MKKGLEPIIFDDSEILILGSLPSDMSIQNEKYYDNPRNQFWDIISYVFEESMEFETYEHKVEFLKKHRVALWDVIKCADNILDLGPEGGKKGGQIVAVGTPEKVAKCEESHTGRFLKKYL